MAFWSGETLLSRLPALIDTFDPSKVDCAAYTLRMGAEVYVSPSEAEQDPNKITIQKLANGQAFTIPSGQFAFLLTEEHITVPRDKIAFISMKTGIKLRGLVNVSGFHVDPGYSGHLIFAVFNAGPRTVHLRRGDDCFLIWYADLDNPQTTKAKDSPGFGAITTEIVTRISGEVMSFEGLNAKINSIKDDYNNRIHRIEREQGIIKFVAARVLTVLIGVAVTPLVRNWWTASTSVATVTEPTAAQPQKK